MREPSSDSGAASSANGTGESEAPGDGGGGSESTGLGLRDMASSNSMDDDSTSLGLSGGRGSLDQEMDMADEAASMIEQGDSARPTASAGATSSGLGTDENRIYVCQFGDCAKKYSNSHSRRQHYRRQHKEEWDKLVAASGRRYAMGSRSNSSMAAGGGRPADRAVAPRPSTDAKASGSGNAGASRDGPAADTLPRRHSSWTPSSRTAADAPEYDYDFEYGSYHGSASSPPAPPLGRTKSNIPYSQVPPTHYAPSSATAARPYYHETMGSGCGAGPAVSGRRDSSPPRHDMTGSGSGGGPAAHYRSVPYPPPHYHRYSAPDASAWGAPPPPPPRSAAGYGDSGYPADPRDRDNRGPWGMDAGGRPPYGPGEGSPPRHWGHPSVPPHHIGPHRSDRPYGDSDYYSYPPRDPRGSYGGGGGALPVHDNHPGHPPRHFAPTRETEAMGVDGAWRSPYASSAPRPVPYHNNRPDAPQRAEHMRYSRSANTDSDRVHAHEHGTAHGSYGQPRGPVNSSSGSWAGQSNDPLSMLRHAAAMSSVDEGRDAMDDRPSQGNNPYPPRSC